jgi:hypothetical protein
MHCGGRTEAPPDPGADDPAMAEVTDAEPEPYEWDEEETAPADREASQRKIRGGALIWIALALAGVLARACDVG